MKEQKYDDFRASEITNDTFVDENGNISNARSGENPMKVARPQQDDYLKPLPIIPKGSVY